MAPVRRLLALLVAIAACSGAGAANASPDEEALGRERGYPAAPTLSRAFEERYRVGSFSAMDRLGAHCTLPAAEQPLALPEADAPKPIRYRFDGQTLTLDDYMQRQRATALIVLKDGRVVAERYAYGRTAQMRMLSNSIAKTILALGIGKAVEEGLIASLDDTAAKYVPELAGTLLGDTRLFNLLRMASGVRFTENYTGRDDHARFNAALRERGAVAALRDLSGREAAEGTRFNYVSAQSMLLGLVLRAAAKRSLCEYIGEKVWQPIGAQAQATWLINPVDGVEVASGYFNATARDYARLGAMMAADGMAGGRRVLAQSTLLDMSDPARQPAAFRPGLMDNHGSTYYGYGLQTWLLPGVSRRFVMLGVYGQAVYVDPALKLVMVHMAAGAEATSGSGPRSLGAERDALWRGVVGGYGAW